MDNVLSCIALIIAIVALILAAVSLGSTIPDSRLSSNVDLLNADQAFTREHGFLETRLTTLRSNATGPAVLDWDLAANQVTSVVLDRDTTLNILTGGINGFSYSMHVSTPEGVGLYILGQDFEIGGGLRIATGNSEVRLTQRDGPIFFVNIINQVSLITTFQPSTRYSTESKTFYTPESGGLVTWFDQGFNGYDTTTTGTVLVHQNIFGSLAGMRMIEDGNFVGKTGVESDSFFGQGINTTMFFVVFRSFLTRCKLFSFTGAMSFEVDIGLNYITMIDNGTEYQSIKPSFSDDVPFMVAIQVSPQKARMFANNSQLITTFAGPFVNKSGITGVLAVGDNLEGYLAECLIYNRTLTDFEILAVGADLMAIYGVPLLSPNV
jgi:hypothetical protein